MTTAQIWSAIRGYGKTGWQFVDAAGKQTLTVELLNTASGVWVYGCTGTLKTQLEAIGGEIKQILMDDCEDNFPSHQGVKLTVDGTVPAFASPPPPQDPLAPPKISPPLPPTTPPTTSDKIYYV